MKLISLIWSNRKSGLVKENEQFFCCGVDDNDDDDDDDALW